MKALICGDRNWYNVAVIRNTLWRLKAFGYDTIIEGEAKGADSIARDEALKLGFTVLKYPAKWKEYREKYPVKDFGFKWKSAGNDRNTQMLEEGKPDLVVAFHPDLQRSKGTKDMVNKSLAAGVKVIIIKGEEG